MTQAAEILNRYSAKPRFFKIDNAQEVGDWLAGLAGNAKLTGLKAEKVVMEAKSKKSPAHKYLYAKSDAELAFAQRCHLARQLIDSIVYIEPRSQTTQRSVTYVRTGEVDGYVSTDTVLSNSDMVKAKQREAVAALQRWLVAYSVFATSGSKLEGLVLKVRESLGG